MDNRIDSGIVFTLYSTLLELGCSKEEVSTQTGFDPAMLDGQSFVDLNINMALWAFGLRRFPDLALEVGKREYQFMSGDLKRLIDCAKDINEMSTLISRYSKLVSDLEVYNIKQTSKTFELHYNLKTIGITLPHIIERTLVAHAACYEARLGKKIKPVEVHFQFAEPVYAAKVESFFGCEPTYLSNKNSLIFNSQETVFAFPDVQESIKDLYSAFGHYADSTLMGKAETFIINHLPLGRATVDLFADHCGTSRRTISRALKAENTSFTELIESTRKSYVFEYLKLGMPKIHIALLLGYGSISALNLAIKRWERQPD